MLPAEFENVLAELGAPFREKGEAGLQGGEVFQSRGIVRGPGGVERAEFGEGGGEGGVELREGGFEHAAKRGFFRGEQGAGERAGGGGFLLPEGFQRAAVAGELHEKIGERGRNRCGAGEERGRFEREEMAEAGGGFAEDGVGGVERGERRVAAAGRVGMLLRGGALKALAQRLGIEPRTARLGEDGEVIGHGGGSARRLRGGGQGEFSRRRAEMGFARAARCAMDVPLPAL